MKRDKKTTLELVKKVNDGKPREEVYRWWEDETKLAKLEASFKMGMNVEEACLIAEITLTQYYYFTKNIDKDYKAKVEVWQLTPVATAKANLHESLQTRLVPLKTRGGDVVKDENGKIVMVEKDVDRAEKINSSKWLLERKAKNEYSTRKELTGKDGKDVLTPQTYVSLLKTLDIVLGTAEDEDIPEGTS